MSCTFMLIFAIDLLIRSEITDPEKPTITAKTDNAPMSRDDPAIPPKLMPNTIPTTASTILSITTTAILVRMRSPIRFNMSLFFS